MQAVMKQMGISQEEIDASKVIIEKQDGNKLVINNPSVVKIKMQGQESLQISGDIEEESDVSESDIKIVMEKTGCSKTEAKQSLQETGDLAESILNLTSGKI
ncbi:MAG TPA: nascent polypeptide-associated complex protein [Candidatus Pacearchaeota archaeon]|nr:nascent polypeptide-associated complex protein [Candidatus Pacearchaeota archaeon]